MFSAQQLCRVTVTATNGQNSAKTCLSLSNFLCYTLPNNILWRVNWCREKTNAAIQLIDHEDVIAKYAANFHNEK